MNKLILLALLLPLGAAAQVQMDDGGPCYSWQGGNYSAGSFSKCPQPLVVAKAKPVAAPLPTPQIAPSPIMMPMTCVPAPKATKRVVKKRKPLPKC
jgi:hypothetical protein